MTTDAPHPTLDRTPVNPWPWSLPLGYNQAEILTGATRHLVCAGQTSVDTEGTPQHPGDMRAQLDLALENLGAVLASADMGFADVVRLSLFTTDVDELVRHLDLLAARLGPTGTMPPMTLLGVTRLALAPLLVEVEAAAAA
jgi:enamine deaminase RidA (YjgF/YER057c/UK114 family)